MTSEELDRRIIAYKRGNKPTRTFNTPLDTKIAAYYRQHPEAQAAVNKARNDPRGLNAVTQDILTRANNRMIYGEHYTGGTVLSVH